MAKKIIYQKEAVRALSKIPVPQALTIIKKIEQYASDPPSQANNVKRLSEMVDVVYRLRVGDYRVLFTEDRAVIDVIRIGPRGKVYS